jgi:carbamoyl-phosphate synthase large subunit
MRSTGEVMGVAPTFPVAFAKSQIAAGTILPDTGRVFLSVSDRHKDLAPEVARQLLDLGYEIISTAGTAACLEASGIPIERVKKIKEGHPNLLDHLIDNRIALVLNTPSGKGARTDEGKIRAAAVQQGVPCITTMQAALAVIRGIQAQREQPMTVQAIQERTDPTAWLGKTGNADAMTTAK